LSDLFGDEAGNSFFSPSFSEDSLTIEENPEPLEKPEKLIVFQKILEMPGSPGVKVSLVDNIGFKDDSPAFFQSFLHLWDQFPAEIVEIHNKIIPFFIDLKCVQVGNEGVDFDAHLLGQHSGFFQTDRRQIDSIHITPVQRQADGISAFSRSNVKGLSLGKKMEVFSKKQIRLFAKGKSLFPEPLIPAFLIRSQCFFLSLTDTVPVLSEDYHRILFKSNSFRQPRLLFYPTFFKLFSRRFIMARGEEGIGDRYHQETRYRRYSMQGGGLDWAHQPSLYKEFPHASRRLPIQPPVQEGGKPLWETIGERRSLRNFSSYPLPFSDFSRLIWATQGITFKGRGYDFRACPSAGALYPIETYVTVNRVEGVSPGIYHYHVKKAELALLTEGNFGPELAHAGLGQEILEEAAAVFVWTAVIERSKWKYRERAYRYIYMDAGHIGQNLYLAATALNLGCCTVGAFFDEEVDRLLGINGEEEISVYLGAVGKVE
jgi:SagB-type dehydrogenase family enzyme